MAAGLLIFPEANPSFGLDGERVSAKLYFYLNQTPTPTTVYQDSGLTTPHTHPVSSDAFGNFANIYGDTANSYTVTWVTADGQTRSFDNFSATTAANQTILDDTQEALDDALAILGDVESIDAAVTASAGSATAAAGSATAAAGSATSASGFATAAASSATAAAGSATAAAGSATSSASARDESKSYTGAVTQTFDAATGDADPGAGKVRMNNASPASTTFLYADDAESGGGDVSGFWDAFDNSTNATKGIVHVRQGSNGAFAIFTVTGAVINGSGYRKIPVGYLAGNGSFTNGATVGIGFSPSGDVASNALFGYATKSSGYTLAAADLGKVIDCTATLTLAVTAAATLVAGWFCFVRAATGATVTVDPNGSETIGGASTLQIYQNEVYLVGSDGTNIYAVVLNREGGAHFHAQYQVANNTPGETAVTATWTKATINTVVSNPFGISLSSSEFTLGAGIWEICARVPMYQTGRSRCRIRNITDGTTAGLGSGCDSTATTGDSDNSFARARVTLTTSKALAVQYYASAVGSLGSPVNSGDVEVHSEVWVTRVA